MARVGSGQSGVQRVGAVVRALPVMKTQMAMVGAGHCKVAQMLAGRLPLPRDYTAASARSTSAGMARAFLAGSAARRSLWRSGSRRSLTTQTCS